VTSVELVRRSLEAIEASQPELNAFRVVLTEQALADAAAADRKRAAGEQLPLLGIPIAVKDDVDVAGVPTRFGTAGDPPPATADAEVVRRLRRRRGHRRQDQHLRAGPVAVHQRAGLRAHPQPVVAPTQPGWVLRRQRRGGGRRPGARRHRLRRGGQRPHPGAWTHLVGIKPQRGRISTWPLPEAFNGITVNGVLARTVTDAALVLDAASGNTDGDLHKPAPVRVSEHVGRAPARCASRCPRRSRSTVPLDPAPGDRRGPARRGRSARTARAHRAPGRPGLRAADVIQLPGPVHRGAGGVVAAAGPDVRLDKRTRSNIHTGWLLSQHTLRKARAAEADAQRRVAGSSTSPTW
jgi:amidase